MSTPLVGSDEGVEDPYSQWNGWRHSRGWVYGLMLVSSVISLVAAFVISVDALKIAADPDVELACSINAVIDCGAVAKSWQAQLLGFPNSFLGLMFEPAVIVIAVASLAKVRFPRWFMLTAQGIYLIALFFAYWLFSQSMFSIGALCPWCLLVTVSTTGVFMEMWHANVVEGNLRLPGRAQTWMEKFFRWDLDAILVIGWFAILAVAILVKYGLI